MNLVIDLIHGISVGIEYVEEDEVWIFDLIFLRVVWFVNGFVD